ncbi:MAG: hypothetical protein LRY53_09090 [Burkholderiaceae bacterium]|nr:hypothetical protein [Burkholderiaceae bacterium]MCD8516373.1 hypothetical protein [Burkholderiaceae bacterium]MCD8538228.1 hypothetical protein [Burkholderiaceae bacterium]MCD8565767.1 hypothetical protein [Burkholderiaceae bacterium]
MKILIVVLLVTAAAYFYPQLNEGVSSPCGAVEKRFVRDAFAGSDGGDIFAALLSSGATNGALAAAMIKSAYPNLPATLGCLRTYYELMADPDLARTTFDSKSK